MQDILNRINEYDVGGGSNPNVPDPTPVPDDEKQDGSWNGTKEMNSPKVAGTGLIPVYHNGTNWVDLTKDSSEEEWANWYDYENQKWANARTADGSMWVWIPRFEYQIQSGNKIDVRFIKTDVKAGTAGYTTDSTGIVKSSGDYIVHPAFMDDTANGFNNGGWDSDIEGFWVAKYPAGWQNGTNGVDKNIGTPEYSNLTYKTSLVSSTPSSYVGQIEKEITKMSYPVFKADNYVYNYISIGDAYRLSKEIAIAHRYELEEVDSHLQKNSEWGAVVYLAYSKYGVNGQNNVAQNTTNKSSSIAGIYAVTSSESTVNTSTTQNKTGVYDLSGCIYERTAGFYQGGSTSCTTGMLTSESSRDVTVYKANDKKGDATNETAGWNGNCAGFFILNEPVFNRGGYYNDATNYAGLFYFNSDNGTCLHYHGFRVVLIPN